MKSASICVELINRAQIAHTARIGRSIQDAFTAEQQPQWPMSISSCGQEILQNPVITAIPIHTVHRPDIIAPPSLSRPVQAILGYHNCACRVAPILVTVSKAMQDSK